MGPLAVLVAEAPGVGRPGSAFGGGGGGGGAAPCGPPVVSSALADLFLQVEDFALGRRAGSGISFVQFYLLCLWVSVSLLKWYTFM